MLQPVAVAFGGGRCLPRVEQLGLDPLDLGPGRSDRSPVDPPEGIEQGTVAAGVEQAAVVVLAVDLDQAIGNVAKDSSRDARPPGERAAATVGLERTADQQRL